MCERILRTITAATLAGIMLVAGSGCGSNHPTTTATSTPSVDVIKQIETDCGVQSERGKKLMYIYGTSVGSDYNEVQCVTNHMPDAAYEQLEKDEERGKLYSETHSGKALHGGMDVDGYSWTWTVIRNYDTAETHLCVEKQQ